MDFSTVCRCRSSLNESFLLQLRTVRVSGWFPLPLLLPLQRRGKVLLLRFLRRTLPRLDPSTLPRSSSATATHPTHGSSLSKFRGRIRRTTLVRPRAGCLLAPHRSNNDIRRHHTLNQRHVRRFGGLQPPRAKPIESPTELRLRGDEMDTATEVVRRSTGAARSHRQQACDWQRRERLPRHRRVIACRSI